MSKFGGDSTYGTFTKIWCRTLVGIPHMELAPNLGPKVWWGFHLLLFSFFKVS
jgi:hypothetical protein